MNPRNYAGMVFCAVLSCAGLPAYALDGAAPVPIDGGPLGPLNFSAAGDGYFFGQTGSSANPHTSVVGGQPTGAAVDAWMLELHKISGLVQFTVQLAEFQNINLGANRPQDVNGQRFTTGAVRTAYVTLAPAGDFKISLGQFPSVEGYESVFAFNNPVGLRTVIAAVENSNSRGVQLDYNHGPLAATVLFGDGYDTGVWNYVQFIASDHFDANNVLYVFGAKALGVTGPNTFAYESGTGPLNGNGSQGQLANINSNMIGAWYEWKHGNLSLTPEVQFQYTNPINQYANVVSGGVSDNIPKSTGNFAAALFGEYKFSGTPYSIAGWTEYATSYGSAAQDNWFVAPNAKLVGVTVAPTWQHEHLFARLNAGYMYLLDSGSPAAGYGNSGTGRNQFITTLEFGIVY